MVIHDNLKTFITVAKNKSFTKTAKELFVSQPAVSKAIKNLEEELQVKLFQRDKRKGLNLTNVGKEILLYARQMENLENKIYQAIYLENNLLSGQIRVAALPIITTMILVPIFKIFKEKYPLVNIELIEGTAFEVREAVLNHHVDFGLSTSPFQDLETKFLLTDKMCAISSQKLSNEINLYNQAAENLIFCQAGQETAMEILHSYNISFDRSFIVKQPETAVKFVEENYGIGIISEFVLSSISQKSIHKIDISPKIEIEFGIVATDFSDLSPSASKMVEMIANQFHQQNKT
ncbi:LysR family transcriptional regulator [Streptococcus sp. H49]|uniref:LysR family transcriptional regulator n=1 Tax=Streptococcus huangxiaojuni TaxID=3237239 RepID=UPI0034A1C940